MPGESTKMTLSQSQDQAPAQLAQIYFLSSLFQGVLSTGIFSPFDRALYRAQVHNRPFWIRANFISPYQGCYQAMALRCLTGSTYYIAQDEGRRWLAPILTQQWSFPTLFANLSVGFYAGTINGIVRHPPDAVKYLAWGHNEARLIPTANAMWQFNGLKSFTCGMPSTIGRDSLFGIVYEMTRYGLQHLYKKYDPDTSSIQQCNFLTLEFINNTISGFIATLAASPLNYARNMQLHFLREMLDGSIPKQSIPRTRTLLSDLNHESKIKGKTTLNRASFFARRLKMGEGTLRSGIGMAMGQFLFGQLKEVFSNHLPQQSVRLKK